MQKMKRVKRQKNQKEGFEARMNENKRKLEDDVVQGPRRSSRTVVKTEERARVKSEIGVKQEVKVENQIHLKVKNERKVHKQENAGKTNPTANRNPLHEARMSPLLPHDDETIEPGHGALGEVSRQGNIGPSFSPRDIEANISLLMDQWLGKRIPPVGGTQAKLAAMEVGADGKKM